MKIMCTPLTDKAMSLLDINACPDDQMARLILTNAEHLQLQNSGIFEEINNSLRKLIDDYEDEHIKNHEDLSEMLRILEKKSLPENPELLKKLIHLNKLAIDKKLASFSIFKQ